MLRADAVANGVTTVSQLRPAITVRADDWRVLEDADRPHELARSVAESARDSVVGEATALSLPPGPVTVTSKETEDPVELTAETALAGGSYEIAVDSAVRTHVAFTLSTPARFERNPEGSVVEFAAPTTVRIGFSEGSDEPPGTIEVPRTPDGAAAALSTLSATNLTTTAARSHSLMRRTPPRVTYGDEMAIPERFRRATDRTDVELLLPESLDYLLPAASLTHYLGARVTLSPGATPTLRTPELEHEFDSNPGFQYEVATMLRRVFLLDCLVRKALPGNDELAEAALLDRLPLDADALADAPISRRVEAYDQVPFDLVSPDLPEWHLSMYIDPDYDNLRTLPHLLANLPNVFIPDTQPLAGNERLRRSLDEFYRGSDEKSSQVKPVKPLLGPGRVHGWLADGIPIDVFKAFPEAYEHRTRDDREDGTTSVVAVLNDAEMSSEHDDAAEIYRQGTANLDIDVSVREHLSRDELAAVFEGDHDFVHYIGHCEESGLRCRDGSLSTSTLDRSGAETFFLNACGSYYEGTNLITKGSVAGAVTFEKVLDGHAARVGTMFVRLLVNGFSIERALNLARRRIIMGTDYTVVGDGTHKLSGAPEAVPLALAVTPTPDDENYQVTFDVSSPRVTGDVFCLPEPFDGQPRLFGAESSTVMSPAETEQFVRSVDLPVVFDGDIQWSTDLAGRLGT